MDGSFHEDAERASVLAWTEARYVLDRWMIRLDTGTRNTSKMGTMNTPPAQLLSDEVVTTIESAFADGASHDLSLFMAVGDLINAVREDRNQTLTGHVTKSEVAEMIGVMCRSLDTAVNVCLDVGIATSDLTAKWHVQADGYWQAPFRSDILDGAVCLKGPR